jgi:NAD(P)H-quinone oxidoreductase subunit I
VVDWEMNKESKKKQLKHYSIDFGVCIFCANCIEYCPTNCLSATEEYELAAYDRHELNYDNVALGRIPYKVTNDPMVQPMREFAYLPKGVIDPHTVSHTERRAGLRPEEILEQSETPNKD